MMTRAPLALLAGMAALSIVAAVVTSPASAEQGATGPDVLSRVVPGAYRLNESGGFESTLCIADPIQVMQVGHADTACTHSVLERTSSGLIVSYTCPGRGTGLSELTSHINGRFKLHAQGISRGTPFDTKYEASRIGECGAMASVAARR